MAITIETLGNVIRFRRYLGQCFDCGSQFMGTSERVGVERRRTASGVVCGHTFYCLRCADLRRGLKFFAVWQAEEHGTEEVRSFDTESDAREFARTLDAFDWVLSVERPGACRKVLASGGRGGG